MNMIKKARGRQQAVGPSVMRRLSGKGSARLGWAGLGCTLRRLEISSCLPSSSAYPWGLRLRMSWVKNFHLRGSRENPRACLPACLSLCLSVCLSVCVSLSSSEPFNSFWNEVSLATPWCLSQSVHTGMSLRCSTAPLTHTNCCEMKRYRPSFFRRGIPRQFWGLVSPHPLSSTLLSSPLHKFSQKFKSISFSFLCVHIHWLKWMCVYFPMWYFLCVCILYCQCVTVLHALSTLFSIEWSCH